MAWSGLASLLEQFLPEIDDLPPARAAAIRGALALADGGAPIEPFAVAVATRDLLAEADEAVPILVVVDDLPWIDEPTRAVLAYVADDIELEHVAVLAAQRADGGLAPSLGATIEIDGLVDAVADQLLVDAGVSSAEVRRRLREAASAATRSCSSRRPTCSTRTSAPVGPCSPIRCRSAPAGAGPPSWRSPASTRRRGRRWSWSRQIPTATRPGCAPPWPPTATRRVPSSRPSRAACSCVEGDRLVFRHPLIRAATYHGATRTAQRAAHRALATTLPERSPARAWHLARSALGPDEEIAAALDSAATMTAHLGAPNLAARTWEAASRLSPHPADRSRRLRLAAAAELDAGLTHEAGELLNRAEQVALSDVAADDGIERTHRLRLRCRLPPADRRARRCHDPTAPGGRRHRGRRARPRRRRPPRCPRAGDRQRGARRHARHRRVPDRHARPGRRRARPPHRHRPRRLAAPARRSTRRGRCSIGSARSAAPTGRRRTPASSPASSRPRSPTSGTPRRRTSCSTVLEADLRSRGAIRALVDVLAAQAMAHYGRSFPNAIAAARRGDGPRREPRHARAGSPGAPAPSGSRAAVVGDPARCEQAAALLATADAPERRLLGPISLAYLALNEGRLDDADEIYRRLATELPLGRGLIRWETEWVETLAKLGRRAEGADVLDRLVAGGTTPDVAPAPRVRAGAGVRRRRRGDGPRPLRRVDRRRRRPGQPVRRGPRPPGLGRAAAAGPPPRRRP